MQKNTVARRVLSWVVMAVVALACLAGPARAADDPQRAKELFQQGTTYFDVGQFDKAIESWQEGYKAKPDPGFLYNIAQAYRLSGDAPKAIFFYKGYLRNSPKAANRADVEQKIAALQKQAADPDRPKPAAAAPPPAASPPPAAPAPPGPPVVAKGPPPLAAPFAPPPAMAGSTEPPPAPAGPPAVVSASPPVAAPDVARPRPFDVGAALGSDFWTSGLAGSSQPSFALSLAGGYTFEGDPQAALHFRLGALFSYTFLDEPKAGAKETFTAFLLVPSLRVRLMAERLYLHGELGIGALGISGLKPASALLEHDQGLAISGTQGMLELRPAVGLEVRLRPSLSLTLTSAVASSPKRPHFHAAITRVELLAGLMYRL